MQKSRLFEPSTYAGLSGLFAGLAALPMPDEFKPWVVGIAGMFGSVAIALREGIKPASKEDVDSDGLD